MIHLHTLIGIGIAILVVSVVVAVCELRIRNRWKSARKQQIENLKLTSEELAQKHPNELRDMLTNTRDIQTINAAYIRKPKIRAIDRENAQRLQGLTDTQIETLHAAIVESVRIHAEQGHVTPTHV